MNDSDSRDGLAYSLALLLVAGIIIAGIWIADLAGVKERWQAQAELNRAARIQEQAELVEQRQQAFILLPGVVAQLTDTMLSTILTLGGWLLALVLAVLLVVVVLEIRRERLPSKESRDG